MKKLLDGMVFGAGFVNTFCWLWIFGLGFTAVAIAQFGKKRFYNADFAYSLLRVAGGIFLLVLACGLVRPLMFAPPPARLLIYAEMTFLFLGRMTTFFLIGLGACATMVALRHRSLPQPTRTGALCMPFAVLDVLALLICMLSVLAGRVS